MLIFIIIIIVKKLKVIINLVTTRKERKKKTIKVITCQLNFFIVIQFWDRFHDVFKFQIYAYFKKAMQFHIWCSCNRDF